MEISLENLGVDIGAESVNTNKLKIHYLATYHNNALHVIIFLRTLYCAYQYTSLLKLITSCYCILTIFLSCPFF